MRLLYITVSMPFGPHEGFFIPEVKELLRQGCQLRIVPRSPRGEVVNRHAEGLEPWSIRRPIFSLGILAAALSEMLRHPLRTLRALGLLLRSRNLPTLLKNLAVVPKGLWLARVARKWQADHIHAQWALTTSTLAMIAGLVAGIPWSCTAHRGDIAPNNLLATKLAQAKFVRFISESGVRMAEGLGAPCPRDKALIIRMGITMPAWQPGMSRPGQSNLVLCPANLVPVKGHQYLLQAMAILRDRGVACGLHIAGDGEMREPLQALARQLSLDGVVRFLGHVLHADVLERYRQRSVEIVALPSVDLGHNVYEGVPVALVEAMGYGIPVISTSTGGIAELLRDDAGIMVPPQDPLALADAIQRLIHDPALRQRTAETGRRRVEEEFAIERVVARFLGCMEV